MSILKKAAVFILSILFCLSAVLGSAENGGLEEISPEELQEKIDNNPFLNLFDLRSTEEYDAGHIPSASSFPLETLADEIEDILSSGYSYMAAQIILYGANEEDSLIGSNILWEHGFSNVLRLKSIDQWTGQLITTEEEMRLLGNIDTEDLYGNPVDSSLLEGHRLTLVNAWATFCAASLEEMEDLGVLAGELESKGVQIVGLLCDVTGADFKPDPEVIQTARNMVASAQANYPQIIPSIEIYRKVVVGEIVTIPTTFFVDEKGAQVGGVYIGARNYEQWKAIIEEMLEKMPD